MKATGLSVNLVCNSKRNFLPLFVVRLLFFFCPFFVVVLLSHVLVAKIVFLGKFLTIT